MIVKTPSGKEVEIRKATLGEMNILLDETLARNGKTFTEFLHTITGMSRAELEELPIGDRFFLIIEIRRLTKGDIAYQTVHTEFGTKEEVEINLAELELTVLGDEEGESVDENGRVVKTIPKSLFDEELEFDIELPVSGKTLTARILKGKHEKDIVKAQREYSGSLLTYMMMVKTSKIAGEQLKNIKFFNNLDFEDAEAFNEEYEKRNFGLRSTCRGISPGNGEFEFDINLDYNFFFKGKKSA